MATTFQVTNASLTADDVRMVLARRFESQYDVYKTRMPFMDFIIKKNGLIGVGVRVRNESDGTSLTLRPLTPSKLAFFALHQWVWSLLLRGKWESLEYEIQTASAKEPEFE